MPAAFRVCIAALAVVFFSAAAAAEDAFNDLSERLRQEPFELTADSLHYDMERELYIGRGDVTIRQSARSLRADWVAFNRKTGIGVASGHVEVQEDADLVKADFIQFQLDTLEGTVRGGILESQSTRFRASAAEISKTGPQTYSFREGRFTTCRCPNPEDTDPWVLDSEEAELEIEGYATARNTTFEVLGVPVAWIPWMIFPVKTQRQSGLLFPEVSFGSFSGFEVGLPIFWAMREDAGLVVTPRYSSDRGFGSAAHLDYVAGEQSSGNVLGAYYHDLKIDPNSPNEPFSRDRWSASGAQDWFLPGKLRFQTDFRFASDNEVPFDFKELQKNRSDRFLESQAALSRSFGARGRVGALIGANYVDDLQNPDNLDRDLFMLQRWPYARVDWLAGALDRIPFVVPSLDVDYTWFQARNKAEGVVPLGQPGSRDLFLDTGVDALPDPASFPVRHTEQGPPPDPSRDDFALFKGGTEGDGVFQEGEPLTDRGQRLLLQPRLALPLAWHGISLVPEVGWYQTLYDSRLRDFRERGFVTTRVDVSTRLRRTFEGFVHVLEPRAGYALAYTNSQDGNPLFVPDTSAPQNRIRALDLDTVTLDEADRIERASRLTAGFGNRLYRTAEGGKGSLLADFVVLGQFDIEREVVDALIIDGRAFPVNNIDLRYHIDFDPEELRVDEGLLEGLWTHPSGVAFNGGYRWARRIPLFFENFNTGDRFDNSRDADHINQIRAGISLDLTARWSVRYGIAYSIEGNLSLVNQGLVEYLSSCGCWALGLELSQDRTRGVGAKVVYRLVGLGGDPPRVRPSLLDGW